MPVIQGEANVLFIAYFGRVRIVTVARLKGFHAVGLYFGAECDVYLKFNGDVVPVFILVQGVCGGM